MKKNAKGITLVAMVITIIVMLILAGVSISMVVGDNGVLTRAQQGSIDTQLSSAEGDIGLSITSNQTEFFAKAAENTSISAQKPIYLSVNNFNEFCSSVKIIGDNTASADKTLTFSNVQDFKLKISKGKFQNGDNTVASNSIAAGCTNVYATGASATDKQKEATSAASTSSTSGYKTNVLFFSDGGSYNSQNANNIYVAAVHFEKGFFKVDDIGVVSGESEYIYLQGQEWGKKLAKKADNSSTNDTIENDSAITWLRKDEVAK